MLSEAQDDLDPRVGLEGLDDATAPEGVGSGDQDAAAHLSPSRCFGGP